MSLYDSATLGPAVVRELRDVVRYRDLVLQLISRDVRTRYKRSVLGVGWTMLHPLLLMAVLAVVFSTAFRVDVPHYAVYLLSGLLLWNFFALSTTTAMRHLVWGGPVLTKVYVPKSVFALSAVGTGLVNLALALVPLAGVMLLSGVPLRPALLTLPVPILLAACFALGVALLLSTLAVSFPDVLTMYEIVLTAWYFLTPIIYPVTVLAEGQRSWLVLNPLTHLVEAFRAPIYLGEPASLEQLGLAAIASVGMLLIGWWVFAANADDIPSRL